MAPTYSHPLPCIALWTPPLLTSSDTYLPYLHLLPKRNFQKFCFALDIFWNTHTNAQPQSILLSVSPRFFLPPPVFLPSCLSFKIIFIHISLIFAMMSHKEKTNCKKIMLHVFHHSWTEFLFFKMVLVPSQFQRDPRHQCLPPQRLHQNCNHFPWFFDQCGAHILVFVNIFSSLFNEAKRRIARLL